MPSKNARGVAGFGAVAFEDPLAACRVDVLGRHELGAQARHDAARQVEEGVLGFLGSARDVGVDARRDAAQLRGGLAKPPNQSVLEADQYLDGGLG